MAVRSVPHRAPGNAAKAYLEQLKVSAVAVGTRIEQMRRGGESRCGEKCRCLLAQQPAQNIKDAPERVRPTGQCRGKSRLEQRSLGDPDVDEVIVAVVKQDLRIEYHDHVDPEKHPQQVLVQEKIHRCLALRIRPRKVKNDPAVLTPHGAFDLVGTEAHAVITNIILETHPLIADLGLDELFHGAVIACQEFLAGGKQHVIAEAVCHLDDASCRHPARSDQCIEIRPAPLGRTHLMQDEIDQILVVNSALIDLHRWDSHTLLVDGRRVDGHRARNHAADVRLMPEHGGVREEAPLLEHRQQHQPIVAMTDGAGHRVRIGQQDHVAVFHRAVVAVEKRADVGTELAHDHSALGVGDQRKCVALFADARRHGGPHQSRIHLHSSIAQRVFNDVERDRIDGDRLERLRIGFNEAGHVNDTP